jgi:hypothetical protein
MELTRYEEEPSYETNTSNTYIATQAHLCDYIPHDDDVVSMAQQNIMAEAIIVMGTVTEEDLLLTAASIVEEALQQASGTRIPIKCFGCMGLPKYNDKAYHMWRDCPNKGDQEVWRNFQVNLKKFRKEKQARNKQGYGRTSQYGGGEN